MLSFDHNEIQKLDISACCNRGQRRDPPAHESVPVMICTLAEMESCHHGLKLADFNGYCRAPGIHKKKPAAKTEFAANED